MDKRKLVLSFFISSIALTIGTISMSLAWYAASSRLFIDSVLITIDCTDQLAISTNKDKGYVPNLYKEDLEDVDVFIPVTSAYKSNWIDDKKDQPIFYDDTNFSNDEEASITAVADHGFFSQKLYLKSDVDVFVSVKPSETYIHANAEFNKKYAERLYQEYQTSSDERLNKLSKEEIEERLNHLVNAMRYSILVTDETDYNFCIIDPNKNEETTFGGLLDNSTDGYYDYYKSNTDNLLYERVYGEIIGERSNIVYDEASPDDSDYLDVEDDPSAFNAKHKRDVKRFNKEKSLENGVDFAKEESLSLDDFNKEEKPFVFPVYKDKPQEIVLSIYIEGWDLDSVNYTMGATFISNIAFEILERNL